MLSEAQKKIVTANESKIIVNSAPASGKTFCLVERLKYLLDIKKIESGKIVVITFTNSAAEEIRERLGKEYDNLYIGTVHGYCNYLLNCQGVNTSKYINDKKFDNLFNLFKKHPECRKPVEHLLLDEAQDSTPLQYEFFLEDINPDNWMFVGDFNQSIYGFNGADPEQFKKLGQLSDVKNYYLMDNYRNGENILNYAKRFLVRNGVSDGSRALNKGGHIYEIYYDLFRIGNLVKNNPGDWFILARSNEQINEIYNYLNEKVPCDTFRQAELSNKELKEKMRANTVKILTAHSAKGLEAKNVMVYGVTLYSDEERRLAYVAATRAKENLYWLKPVAKKKNKTKTFSWE